ncbi:MAG: ABC transporter ATP-binding protein, partial [Candidatus Binatia bacterium]
FKDRYPAELSGGQQQRVALARSLVVEPQILLMDEPLSNLDANLREEMRFEIRRLHEEFGITTIYVTHDQAEAMATADRIAVINRGRLVQVGCPADIFDHPKTRFVAEFVGKANILAGRLNADGVLQLGDGLNIHVAHTSDMLNHSEVAVCLRPHNIMLTADASEARVLASQNFNLFAGVIQRRLYLGETVDYTVGLASYPLTLRVVAPPSKIYDKGRKIFALVSPDHCAVVGEE